jgi:hypothetical protein
MENPVEYDVPVLKPRPSASLYLLYLLLGGVSTIVVLFVNISSAIGGWGSAIGKLALLGLVLFMGYSLVRLLDALTNKGRG